MMQCFVAIRVAENIGVQPSMVHALTEEAKISTFTMVSNHHKLSGEHPLFLEAPSIEYQRLAVTKSL